MNFYAIIFLHDLNIVVQIFSDEHANYFTVEIVQATALKKFISENCKSIIMKLSTMKLCIMQVYILKTSTVYLHNHNLHERIFLSCAHNLEKQRFYLNEVF